MKRIVIVKGLIQQAERSDEGEVGILQLSRCRRARERNGIGRLRSLSLFQNIYLFLDPRMAPDLQKCLCVFGSAYGA